MNLLFFLLALAAGAAIAAQAAVNSQLATGLGGLPIMAAFVSFVIGTIALGAIAAATGSVQPAVPHLAAQPLWRLTGGLLGAGAILCTVMLVPRLGLATLLALVIAGQLMTSVLIDHFALLGIAQRTATPSRLIGSVITLVGVIIALFGDRLFPATSAS